MKAAAIVLAAGRGSRMNSGIQKQFMELGGYPLIYYALQVFEHSSVDEVILVTGKNETDWCRREHANVIMCLDFLPISVCKRSCWLHYLILYCFLGRISKNFLDLKWVYLLFLHLYCLWVFVFACMYVCSCECRCRRVC